LLRVKLARGLQEAATVLDKDKTLIILYNFWNLVVAVGSLNRDRQL